MDSALSRGATRGDALPPPGDPLATASAPRHAVAASAVAFKKAAFRAPLPPSPSFLSRPPKAPPGTRVFADRIHVRSRQICHLPLKIRWLRPDPATLCQDVGLLVVVARSIHPMVAVGPGGGRQQGRPAFALLAARWAPRSGKPLALDLAPVACPRATAARHPGRRIWLLLRRQAALRWWHAPSCWPDLARGWPWWAGGHASRFVATGSCGLVAGRPHSVLARGRRLQWRRSAGPARVHPLDPHLRGCGWPSAARGQAAKASTPTAGSEPDLRPWPGAATATSVVGATPATESAALLLVLGAGGIWKEF